MTNAEIIARLECEFKEYLNLRYPDLDIKYYALALDSFQRGLTKGQIMIHNNVSDLKLELFADGTTGQE